MLAKAGFTDDPRATFGSRAVVEVPELQKLMRHICKNGFKHHAAMNCAAVLAGAMEVYVDWDVYSGGLADEELSPQKRNLIRFRHFRNGSQLDGP